MSGRRSSAWLFVYAPLAAAATVSLAFLLGIWWTR